ncbi:MAG TPA: phosphoribosylglycinamide formyltransferase [Gemmataceae bacterium]|nr:phosphoribosylglycinamide formyltransferase [Gemmataceae bacterium]
MHDPIRLAVLLSRGGSTLQNLIDRIAAGTLRAEIAIVLSNKAEAFGLTRARQAGIPTFVVERGAHPSRHEFSARIFALCRAAEIDLVCLAGFLQLLHIPEDFQQRVINMHPALIPAFCGKGYYGLAVHRAVLERGVKFSGCTAHFVDNEYDHGPIISQRVVPVLEDDTPESLADRVFAAEFEAYPQAVQWFAQGRLRIEGRRVRLLSPELLSEGKK